MNKKNVTTLAAAALLSVSAAAAQTAKVDTTGGPVAYMVSDAHLDTQWNWDVQTTIKEYVWNTLNQNLQLLQKYPDYVFNFEGGIKYAWMKEYYPREYELLKEYIKNGRWHISGASWDATDAVVPSVESAIRNIMLGQEYYRNEFGVESTDIFLPDCFGFPYTLPTLANHCGLIGFSSQKLGWRTHPFYPDGSRYPYTVGLWKGIDGSTIMMYHGFDYNGKFNDMDLTNNEELKNLAGKSPFNVVARYYGVGDTGGAPTIASVASVQNSLNGNGPVKIISAASDQIYKDFMPYSSHPELPSCEGELLMDVHGNGCYTSQAAMKLYNRQNELLADAAERAAVGAELLGGMNYPSQRLTDAWKRFIFHQFHDDLTGTSIPRAYEFSWNDELISLKDFETVINDAVSAVASQMDTRTKGTPVVIYNPADANVTNVVTINVPCTRRPSQVTVTGPDGKKCPAQVTGYENGQAAVIAQVSVPANGFAVYGVQLSGTGKETNAIAQNSIDNSRYSIKLDKNGDITSLYDKKIGRELVKDGKAIRLAMFTKNESFAWPAWEILKETLDREPESITENVSIALVEDGPVRKTLRVTKNHGDSKFVQYIRLYEGEQADRVDFFNEIDWRSTDALLKTEFPLAVDNEEATYDLGLGTVKRGNNITTAFEVYAQQWADLTDKSGSNGVTIMNDSKYGWDKPDNNTLRLTLLHTPKTRGGYAYQDHQDWGHHEFTYSLVSHDGQLVPAQTFNKSALINQTLKPFITTAHNGKLGKEYSIASSDNNNIAIKALKKAESSDEYVVRVYDLTGSDNTTATVTFPVEITAAVLADGTEKTIEPAKFSGNKLTVNVKPSGLSTYKVRLAGNPVQAADAHHVALDYDMKAMTWNGFTSQGNFSNGYTYAAELVPSTLSMGHYDFNLENQALFNAMKCEGDTLTLPAGNNFNRLYLLAAATTDTTITCDVRAGKLTETISVPSYTGFVGQWGHIEHTDGYLTDAQIAYVGTHRHNANGDCHYEFTYMYTIPVELAPGTTQVILPNNPDVVIFAATAVKDIDRVTPAAPIFRTANLGNATTANESKVPFVNILKPANIIASIGFVNDKEKPEFMVDGDENTKWCYTGGVPAYVDFDLGEVTELTGWRVLSAGQESPSYVTAACLLMGRDSQNEEWKTLDYFTGNKSNNFEKKFKTPVKARYLRLNVIQPEQGSNSTVSRIYEFGVSK